MVIERSEMVINGMQVEIIRKSIKNLHLSVHPPDGRVRISAPTFMDEEAVRLAIISRLGWIKRQQARFVAQERQSDREMIHGESHYFLGRRYRLMIEEKDGLPQVRLHGNEKLVLQVRPGTDVEKRQEILTAWYRAELRIRISELMEKWQPVFGFSDVEWRIKRMKTRWGTCNIEERRIWFNLELAKKAPQCLEYILVHEMVHLLERHHNELFRELMDHYLPQWQLVRAELNSAPLAYEEWKY